MLNKTTLHCIWILFFFLCAPQVQGNTKRVNSELDSLYQNAYKNFDNSKGLQYANQLFDRACKANDIRMQSKAMLIKSKYLNTHLSHKQFEAEARRIMNWLHSRKCYEDYYHIWVYVIINYSNDSQPVEALNEIVRMQNTAFADKSSYGIQAGYRMLGNLFESRLDYAEALKYYNKEMKYAKKIGSPLLYTCYYNCASCELNMGHYKQAMMYSLAGRKLNKLPATLVYFDIQEGLINSAIGDNERLKQCYQRVAKYISQHPIDSKGKAAYRRLNIAMLWSRFLFDEAYKQIEKMSKDDKLVIMPIHYKRQHLYEKALTAQEKLTLYRDSLNKNFSTNELNEFSSKLKEQKLIHEKQQLQIENNHIRSTQRLIVGISIIVALIGLQTTLILALYFERRKRKLITAESQSKDQFIQDMSHEIRTPLNIINGFVSILNEPNIMLTAADKEEAVKRINNGTKQLTAILDDMLMLSNIESSFIRIEKSTLSPLEICYEARALTIEKHPEFEKIQVRCNIPKDVFVITHQKSLVTILNYLLNNACKFAPDSEIAIGCNNTENKNRITFFVEDKGPGIPDDKAEIIFHRFIKLDRFKPGIGLGLTICKMLAEKIHATLKLDTKYKKGARFIVISQKKR